MPLGQPVAQCPPDALPKGRDSAQRLCRKSKVRIILEMQQQIERDVADPTTDVTSRAAACRAWDTLEERLRILRGIIKPGSRNAVEAPEPKRKSSRSVRDVVRLMQQSESESESGPETGSATGVP